MIKKIRDLVRKINNIFVIAVLIIIYYPVIGVCFAILKLTQTFNVKNEQQTYWRNPELGKFNKEYFKSAY